jgi:hypothetical protein
MEHPAPNALALTFAGFSIGMDGHDRAAAFAAFEAALAVSPSSALTYILGSVILAFPGEAERAIEWGERGMRLSPFDPWALSAYHVLTLALFHRGRYEAAADAAHRSVQSNPALAFPICCWRHRSRNLGVSKKPKLLRREFWNYSRHSGTVGTFPA